MSQARPTWPLTPWAVAAAVAAALAGGSCEPIEQYDAGVPDAGDAGDGGGAGPDGGTDAGDGPATLTSFAPSGNLFIRAPVDGGWTYPGQLAVGVDRGGERTNTLHVEITSDNPAVVVAVGGGVDLPPGSTTATVLLRTFNVGLAVLTARLDGGVGQVANVTVLPTVVISELGAETVANPQDEFVELYNPTGLDFSIAGFALQYRSASAGSSFQNLALLPAGATLRPFGYYLVGFAADYSGPVANATYNAASMSATSGTVRFGAPGIGNTGTEVLALDTVGWGTPASFEGSAMAAPASWGSLERKATATATSTSMSIGAHSAAGNAYDTDFNANDFLIRSTRDPQNSGSGQERPP